MADDHTDPNAPAAAPDSPSGRVYYPVPVQQPNVNAAPTTDAPAAAPDSPSGRVYYPVNTPQSQPSTPQLGSYEDPNTPLPAIWNKPKDVSWDDFILGHLSRPFVGAQQAGKDYSRVIGDTYTLGATDRAIAAAKSGAPLSEEVVGGDELARQQQLTNEAKARLGGMTYPAEALAYILPGPGDVGLAERASAATLKGISKATNTAVEAAPWLYKTAARAVGGGANAAAVATAQDVGHADYNPLHWMGDSAIASTIGAGSTALGDIATGAAREARDWWTGRPSGTPAEITAANPTDPHAAQLETWQNNMKATGEPPSVDAIGDYGRQQFGDDISKWPKEYVNLYNAAKPSGGVGPIGRLAWQGAAGAGQAAGWALGAPFMEDPTVHIALQAGAAGAGQIFGGAAKEEARAFNTGRRMNAAYPALTNWNSTGMNPTASSDAWSRLILPLVTPNP